METTTEATTTVQSPDTAGADTPTQPSEDKTVPISVLHKVREEAAAAKARLAELEAAQRTADEEAAKKRGEYERLYTETKTAAESMREELEALRAEKVERIERVKATNADRIAKLPEQYRSLVIEGLDPETTAAQLAKLEALANVEPPKPQTFPVGGRTTGTGADPDELTPDIKAWVESDAKHLRGVSPRVVRMHFTKFGPGKANT